MCLLYGGEEERSGRRSKKSWPAGNCEEKFAIDGESRERERVLSI